MCFHSAIRFDGRVKAQASCDRAMRSKGLFSLKRCAGKFSHGSFRDPLFLEGLRPDQG
jgi:hypothetical protein